ncbi:hypothetical protein [Desulforhopalus singaporensis]|uniref:GpW protein n=1 Tax=Desulforhopalus singaporensis TaxID=91360 RepID=A0A1H0NSP2_9BACT|nr:hypothetical protein [Desulforhopalus singaporensis]SDO95596.1 hypothetical protein SAMN05660330_01426 [Desulforhopalus singaporensis]
MAFTQTDIDNIERALVDVALGKRVTSITIDGDRTDFADGATINQLKSLLALVKSSVAGSSFSPRTIAKHGRRR